MTRFGRLMRDAWAIDPAIVYLNHGTVGAPPRRVLEAQQAIRDEVERQPSRALFREFTRQLDPVAPWAPGRLRRAADTMAAFVGARGDDFVFVDNATAGANAVLGSLDFAAGDEILVTDHCYGAVAHAATHVARRRGASVRAVNLPYPAVTPAGVVAAIEAGITPATRLVIVDHVTSKSALILPVRDVVERCHARGVRVLVDGAHTPGAIPLDVPSAAADFYIANLHKWAWTPRSLGFLWVAPEHQASIHPTVISWGFDQGFAPEFDWAGTRDVSAALAAPAAIAFMRELGVEAVMSWNHALAIEAGRILSARLDTTLETPESMIGCMITVPLPAELGSNDVDAARLRDALLFDDGIEVQVHAEQGRLWTRVSAQIYNDAADIERLADALATRTAGVARR